jgi:hypothetical protein
MEQLLRGPGNGRLAKDLRPASLAAAIECVLRDRAAGLLDSAAIRASAAGYGWSRVAAEVLKTYDERRDGANNETPLASIGFHHQPGRPACCGCGAATPA